MSSTRSKGEANLTNFTDDPEKIGKNKHRRKSRRMADAETAVPQHENTEENNQPPQDNKTEDTEVVTPTEEMYLPDLDNTPLSQALKDGIEFGLEDEVMVECPKLKQYFRVDTLLVQAISGRVRLYTNNEIETFPIHCSKTKFSPSLLDKVLKGVEKQRATPKDLLGEDWLQKLKTVLSRRELDKRLDAYAALCGTYARNSVTLEHTHMVNSGTADDYQNIAKYELRGRKISNRTDKILAIIIQDNAFREQAGFQTYPRPSISPINQLITSPTDANKIAEAAQKEVDDITAVAFPMGTQPPVATTSAAVTQMAHTAPPTTITATAVTIAADHLDHGKQQCPA